MIAGVDDVAGNDDLMKIKNINMMMIRVRMSMMMVTSKFKLVYGHAIRWIDRVYVSHQSKDVAYF